MICVTTSPSLPYLKYKLWVSDTNYTHCNITTCLCDVKLCNNSWGTQTGKKKNKMAAPNCLVFAVSYYRYYSFIQLYWFFFRRLWSQTSKKSTARKSCLPMHDPKHLFALFFSMCIAPHGCQSSLIGQQTSNLLEVFGQSINNLRVGTCKETASHLNEKITMTVDKHLSRWEPWDLKYYFHTSVFLILNCSSWEFEPKYLCSKLRVFDVWDHF